MRRRVGSPNIEVAAVTAALNSSLVGPAAAAGPAGAEEAERRGRTATRVPDTGVVPVVEAAVGVAAGTPVG